MDFSAERLAHLLYLPHPDQVKDYLKCGICKNYPLVPSTESVWFCKAGHLCCRKCARMEKKRGCLKIVGNSGQLCRQEIISPEEQSAPEVVLFLLQSALFSCPNVGCGEKMRGEWMEAHLRVCRPISREPLTCASEGCTFSSNKEGDFWNHVLTKHTLIRSTKETEHFQILVPNVVAKMSAQKSAFMTMVVGEEKFVAYVETRQNSTTFYGYIMNPSGATAAKFQFKIEILAREGSDTNPVLECGVFEFGENVKSRDVPNWAEKKKVIHIKNEFLKDSFDGSGGGQKETEAGIYYPIRFSVVKVDRQAGCAVD